ncbi:hypothetical protein [Martelella endophytica]|uniref:hypothetical protein n=1 Tax=Martelella endophytica TaxID=1486262 RepID=UPI0011856C07|nr:hypothetical protein [Martelella endophytica]
MAAGGGGALKRRHAGEAGTALALLFLLSSGGDAAPISGYRGNDGTIFFGCEAGEHHGEPAYKHARSSPSDPEFAYQYLYSAFPGLADSSGAADAQITENLKITENLYRAPDYGEVSGAQLLPRAVGDHGRIGSGATENAAFGKLSASF